MPKSARLHREANALSKTEKKIEQARWTVNEKQAAKEEVETQIQAAQEKLGELDSELRAALRDLEELEETARAEEEE